MKKNLTNSVSRLSTQVARERLCNNKNYDGTLKGEPIELASDAMQQFTAGRLGMY
jgi:hypothetical protein